MYIVVNWRKEKPGTLGTIRGAYDLEKYAKKAIRGEPNLRVVTAHSGIEYKVGKQLLHEQCLSPMCVKPWELIPRSELNVGDIEDVLMRDEPGFWPQIRIWTVGEGCSGGWHGKNYSPTPEEIALFKKGEAPSYAAWFSYLAYRDLDCIRRAVRRHSRADVFALLAKPLPPTPLLSYRGSTSNQIIEARGGILFKEGDHLRKGHFLHRSFVLEAHGKLIERKK